MNCLSSFAKCFPRMLIYFTALILFQANLVTAEHVNNVETLLNRAKSAYENGKRDEAVTLATQAIAAEPKNPSGYFFRARFHEENHQPTKALADYDQVLKLNSQIAEAWQRRGGEHFKLGHIKESIADFDQFIELVPQQAPHHWQRGIAYYYAGRFADGRKQFESHQTVNPNDVENAVWHFLCVARESSVEKARAALVPIKGDTRVPMMEVHALFAGKAQPEDILKAASDDAPKQQLIRQLFYAHLYLGLYFEALGDETKAREHIQQAAGQYRTDDYMGDVARVHSQLRWPQENLLPESESPKEIELIPDHHFQRGFTLFKPEPGKHLNAGELPGIEFEEKPLWKLLEWSSQFPLGKTNLIKNSDGVLIYSNSAKAITLGTTGKKQADFSMAANANVEYGKRVRQAGEPWVHLLVEKEFDSPPALGKILAAKLHVETRLLHSRLLQTNGYSPDVHAAQFQIFFTVQNLNRNSAGFGDALWFGVPIYDNRHRFPLEFKERDFGGTERFIFTPNGKTYTSSSAHDGDWIVIEKDLLPLMREALDTAWARGFLEDSKNIADYFIGGMNMGWELPGAFDVEMQVRNLSLKISPRSKEFK